MIIETVDPGIEGVRRALRWYVKEYPEYEGPLDMYAGVMESQQRALEKTTCGLSLDESEMERRLQSMTPLVDLGSIDIEGDLYRGLCGEICRILDQKSPSGFGRCDELGHWEGLADENLADTVDRVLAGDELDIDESWSKSDRDIVPNILTEALVPFVRKCGSILQTILDQSLWQMGFCPICGSPPLMGKFREDDGLWLLECCLCHTLWNVRRASCPFCSEGPAGSLNFIFVEGDERYRIQYCETCKKYVKTVDERKGEGDLLLPLEDIVTMALDEVAEKEGLTPARS